jgi:hypothetical protein
MHPDDTVRIPLRARDGSVRAYALVDASDADRTSQWRWCLGHEGYAVRNQEVDGRTVQFLLHRELCGLVKGDGLAVDHRNRNRLDNRRANLLVGKHRDHGQNVPSHRGSTSQYRGVCWNKATGKWMAYARPGNKFKFLGHYASEKDAAQAALLFRQEHMPYATD